MRNPQSRRSEMVDTSIDRAFLESLRLALSATIYFITSSFTKTFPATAKTLLSKVIYTVAGSVERRRRRRRRRVSTRGRVSRAVVDKPVYVLEIARVGFSPRRSFFARVHRRATFLRRPDFLSPSLSFCESPGRKRGHPVD